MFKQTNMPGASAPTLSQVKIDTFLGADLTNSPANADENRSPDCENMIRDVPGKVRKRMGWQVKRTLDGRINGYHALMGHDPLVHAGTKLYKGDSVVYSDANDARSRSWEFGEKLYIADGKALLCYDGTAVTRVDADAYIPTLTIARAPNGGGEEYENANLISPKYREQFLGTENDKVPCAAGQYARGGRAVTGGRKLEADGGKQRLYREPHGGHGHVHHRAGRIPGGGAGQCENHRITHG